MIEVEVEPQLLQDLRRMVKEIEQLQQDIKDIHVFLDKCFCPSGYLMGDAPWRKE